MDTPTEKHMGPAEVVTPDQPSCWPADLFAQRLPEWRKAIAEGRVSADAVIKKAATKYPLSNEQKDAIIEAPMQPMTYADVADALTGAENRQALSAACGLIQRV